MADRGAEAMIESTDDMVCGVAAAIEGAFAAPNSASVLFFSNHETFWSSSIYICKGYLENLNVNGIH